MLEWAARGSGGVTVPESVQESFNVVLRDVVCLVENTTSARWTAGLNDLRGVFQPW